MHINNNFSVPSPIQSLKIQALRKLFIIFTALIIGTVVFGQIAVAAPTRMRGFQVNATLGASDINVLPTWGANVVRYPLVWADQIALDSSDATTYSAWLAQAMNELDIALPIYQAAGIKLIVNLYSPPGGFTRRDSKATHRLFTESWAQDSYVTAWEILAARYANNSNIVAFDLLNEPAQQGRPATGLLDWNKLAVVVAGKIREQSSTMPIVMTPLYGKTTQVSRMKRLPFKNVIYTVHFYEPFRFIHQLVYTTKTYKYPDSFWNRKRLESKLAPVIAFQKKYKARIYIGEFSVARWAPKASSKAYLNDLMFLFEKYKFDWTYHAFREAEVWSLELTEDKNNTSLAPAPTERFKIIQRYLRKNKSL